jgi:DNA polymerase
MHALSSWRSADQPLFGDGSNDARLMFIGEAPGYEEDKMELPFVGASGQLLTRMIESMGLSRNDVYIANILKCRPTENRNPLPEEINACYPILERQISTIAPEVICTLGSFATQAILGDSRGITRLRGRFHEYRGIKVMPTFHPAYLLRNPASKREAWEDLKKIMALLGLKRPEPARG